MKKNVVVRLLTLSMAAACAITNAPITNVSAAELTEVVADEVVVEEASAEDDVVVYNDADQVFAVGTDGVAYSNIGYLTNEEFASLDAETQASYVNLCDSYANAGNASVGFAITEDGSLLSKTSVLSAIAEEQGVSEITFSEEELAADSLVEAEVEDIDLVGNTFEESFFNTQNFFFNQLTEQAERDIYTKIVNAAKKGKTVFTCSLGSRNIRSEKLANAYMCNALNAAMAAYPQYFESVDLFSGVNFGLIIKAGKVVSVKIEMPQSKYWTKDIEKTAKDKVKSIVAEAYAYAEDKYPSDVQYGVVRYFDEYIASNASHASFDRIEDSEPFYAAFTSYGLFNYNRPMTSAGYSKAMMRLLDEAGIRNVYVDSTAVDKNGEKFGHNWNLVWMQNSYYYVVDTYYNDVDDKDLAEKSTKDFLLTGCHNNGRSYYDPYNSYVNYVPQDKLTKEPILDNIITFTAASSDDLASGYYSPEYSFPELHAIFAPKGKAFAFNMTDVFSSKYSNASMDSKNPAVSIKNGKIKSKVVGKYDVSISVGNEYVQIVPLYIYDFDSVTVNGKKSWKDPLIGKRDFKYTFDINELYVSENDADNNPYDIYDIYMCTNNNLKVTCSNNNVAVIDGYEFVTDNNGKNQIVVSGHTTTTKGSAKITCNFGGKKATVSIKVK